MDIVEKMPKILQNIHLLGLQNCSKNFLFQIHTAEFWWKHLGVEYHARWCSNIAVVLEGKQPPTVTRQAVKVGK